MKKTLSRKAINVLNHIITFSGEKESFIDRDGIPKERDVARRVKTNEDSCQRGIFKKLINDFVNKEAEVQKESLSKLNEYKEEWKKNNPKSKGKKGKDVPTTEESDRDYDNRMLKAVEVEYAEKIKELNEKFAEIQKETIEFDLTDKTIEFLKRIFNGWGSESGWAVGDDEVVAELTEVFK